MNKKNTCYACDRPATTKEHAPPFSFFPAGYRENLITVPSCELHNNDNSLDVEYARNVITTYFGVNSVGQGNFNDKAIRSFNRNPALLSRTFGDMRPVRAQGQTIGQFTLENARVEKVMQACVCALHFSRTGQRLPHWDVVLASVFMPAETEPGASAVWLQLLSDLQQIPYDFQPTSSSEVYECGLAEIDGGWVYALRFYRSFVVYAIAPKK